MLVYIIGQNFGGQNFRRTKIVGGQNFRQQVRFSAVLSAEILFDKVASNKIHIQWKNLHQ